MARYDYQCTECGEVFEVEHPMGEHPSVNCPVCGSPAEHVFSASGIVFKGSGYYNTDQRNSTSSASPAPAHETSSKPEKSKSSGEKSKSSSKKKSSKKS